jgi:uncharacterized membrane protein YoaK (UPF0700 family)
MPNSLFRHLSGRTRTETGDARLGMVLAFVAGAINAGGFLAVGQYTSHMSGIVSGFADHLVLNQWRLALMAVAYVMAFFCGAVTSSLLINWARFKGWHSEFAIALMLEALLLLAFGLMASGIVFDVTLSLNLMIALLCYIMGLQNSLITKISHAEIRTTHVTGIITDLGIEIGRGLFDAATGASSRFHPHKVMRLSQLLLAFTCGGVIGALVFKDFGFISVLPFAGLLALIASGPIWDDLRHKPT